MFNNLEKMQRKNTGALKTWFYKDITHGLKKKITKDLYHQVGLFQKLLHEYSAISKKIDSIIEKENIELIKRLLELHHPNSYDTNNIWKVARIQGVLTKILVKNTLFNNDKDRNDFSKVYGERIIEIKNERDEIKFLLDALNVDTTEIINAFYSDKNKRFVVKVKKDVAGKIYGHLWSNLRTAEKIINNKIQIKVV
jgi:transcription antitermination factor NusA-like protein